MNATEAAVLAIANLPEATREGIRGQDRDSACSTIAMLGGAVRCPRFGFLRRPVSWRCGLHQNAYEALLALPLV